MNQNMKFIYGLVIGFCICYFIVKNNAPPAKIIQEKAENSEVITEQPVQQNPKTYKAKKMDLPSEAVHSDLKPEPISLEAKMEMTSRMPAEPIKKNKKIQFSVQDIMTMESEWGNLHNQIQVSKEERGWRVKMLAPNTVFASTGLNEGNLITYDSIRALGDDGNSNLPYRISTILNHVSVQ